MCTNHDTQAKDKNNNEKSLGLFYHFCLSTKVQKHSVEMDVHRTGRQAVRLEARA